MKSNLHIIGSLETGGVERVIETLFSKENYERHEFLVFGKPHVNDIDLPKNINVIYNYNNIFKFLSYMLRNKFDICNFWLHPSIFFSVFLLFKKTRIIWHIHNSDINIKVLGIRNFIVVLINSLISHLIPDKIIFCSKKAIRCHKNFLFSKKKIELIYNPIFNNNFTVKKNFKYKSPLRFVMVANYTKAKDFKKLFRILTKIYKYQFIMDIYGKGIKNNKYLIRLINKNYLYKSVNLYDFTNTKNLYFKYDFKFLVSHTESFPVSIFESLFSNTPFICSDVGDISDIFNDEVLIIPNILEDHFIQKINDLDKIRRNESKYIKLNKNAQRVFSKKFNLNTILNKYRKLWVN